MDNFGPAGNAVLACSDRIAIRRHHGPAKHTRCEDIARNVAGDPDAAPIRSEAETASAIARAVRKRLGISQAEFSARYHVPIGTLRDWEQNRKQPDAPALAYLRVIAREPGVVARALQREAA